MTHKHDSLRRPLAGLLALLGLAPFACTEKMSAETQPMDKSAVTTRISKSGYDVTPLGKAKVAELAKKLTPEQFRVTQSSGTEMAFCGGLLQNHDAGIYTCVVCGL